ncbi:MAG TPA: TetR/AcrR family transcriptional regulator [Streptosporangiaceae bacterium]|nr:TetR/AcrR family transcriptional regulator [Streptosporangiaceae bacterium]
MASNPAPAPEPPPSARRAELLNLAYQYAIQRGRTDITLRPIAAAIGSSPRVLIYLFGSKDGLIRALLGKSRAEEVALLAELRRIGAPASDTLREAAMRIWSYLAEESRRPLLRLWLDGYARSLSQPAGPWAGFARDSVEDWLALLSDVQPAEVRDTPVGLAERTLVLAVLRGALLDLLSTDDVTRVTAAVRSLISQLAAVSKG